MTLDNLLKIGQLKPHVTDTAEISRLLTAARRKLVDEAARLLDEVVSWLTAAHPELKA